MNFGILSAHFGTETQCSVDPSGAKSAYLETSQNLTKPLKNTQKHSKTLIKTHETSQKSKFLNSFAKNANILLKYEKKESQQHPVFPGGHPSKYWLGSMLLNFSDRTRTGVFNMIWPLAKEEENVDFLFQQFTYLLNDYLNSVHKTLAFLALQSCRENFVTDKYPRMSSKKPACPKVRF